MTAELTPPVAALMREAADRFIMPRYGRLSAGEHEEKAPGEDVTIADRESEAFLTEKLSTLVSGSRVVGEEACAADPSLLDTVADGMVWLIDPLDGTTNFKNSEGPFGVMIALLEKGETQGSWVYDPRRPRLCHAHRGAGAFIDGERVRSRASGQAQPVAAISTLFLSSDGRQQVEARAKGQFETVPIPRCAAEQYPRLVLGENDLTLFWRALAWDHAPGALFLEEAGGRIARFDGEPYCPAERREGLLAAATPELWDRANAILFGRTS